MDSRINRTPRLIMAALSVALLTALPVRADLITPDSIPQPPPMVGAADLTPIPSASYLVSDQYAGFGIQFISLTNTGALTNPVLANTGGADVWVPGFQSEGGSWSASVDYQSSMNARFTRPGGAAPAAADSVTVEVINPSGLALVLGAYDRQGDVLGTTLTSVGTGPHGGELLTLTAPDISWFQVSYGVSIGFPAKDTWGVAGIEFTPTQQAPEPCGLVLAAVGIATVAGGALRRRRAPAASAV